jgi:hypothetical protein
MYIGYLYLEGGNMTDAEMADMYYNMYKAMEAKYEKAQSEIFQMCFLRMELESRYNHLRYRWNQKYGHECQQYENLLNKYLR